MNVLLKRRKSSIIRWSFQEAPTAWPNSTPSVKCFGLPASSWALQRTTGGGGQRHFQKTEIKWKNVCSLWCNHLCPGLTSACRLECQVHVSACQEPVAVPGVCTCVGFRELCILAAAAATFHSDILHPFNICVFMWTSWLRSLRLPTLWHRLIRFSTAVSCSSKLIQLRLTWALKLFFFFFLTVLFTTESRCDESTGAIPHPTTLSSGCTW